LSATVRANFMFSIDITLQSVPFPVSVQREDEASAQATYEDIKAAMGGSEPKLIELSCDTDTEKKVAFLSDRIGAVTVSKKSGAASGGRSTGFFGAAAE